MAMFTTLELDGEEDPKWELAWVEAAGETADTSTARSAPLPTEARRLIVLRRGSPVARVAYGGRDGFAGAPGVSGYLGWYAAVDDEAGAWLLRAAAHRLVSSGAERVIAPMDGSTWHRYRVTLPREREIPHGEPFLSEPVNPPGWSRHFAAAGFRPLLEYETRRVSLPRPAPSLAAKRALLAKRGIRLRSLEVDDYAAELRALHSLSLEAFAENAFYSPIPFSEFESLYGPLRSVIDAGLVRLAENHEGRLVGYVFAFPDALAPADPPRIVLKTLAVSREARGWGLGAVLVDEIHAAASQRGAAVLHALMQVTNASRDLSRRSDSELFRRYLLYQFADV